MKYSIKYILAPAILLIAGFGFGQTTDFSNIVNSDDPSKIYKELKKIDTSKISLYDKATWLYYQANYQYTIDNHHKAYTNILKSKKKFNLLNKLKDVADCNILLLSILSHQNNLNTDINPIINELKNYALKQNDTTAIISLYHRIAVQYLNSNNGKESIKYFNKIKSIYHKLKDSLKIAQYNMNIGTVQSSLFNNPDSSLHYNKKALPLLIKHKDYKNLAYNYHNQAQQYKLLGEYDKAIELYLKADSIPIKEFVSKTKIIFYKNLSDAYLLNKNFKNAAVYLDKLNKLKDSVNDTQQNIAISKIKEQYDNEKLRADNLEIESKRKQNRNLLYGAVSLLFFGGVTTTLFLKNSKKKRKLAEQEKILESQKLATVLKEQELVSIDAMIEGQEKERQRIANDLHDDLGGLMATIKLHFNALKVKNSPELFDNTTNLLDEAYQKIRSIAHTKNSGVIAKQGLLKAVKNMAEKISVSNKIQVNVMDHGLENRLENSLELTIFRIIQELITNVIKHANATETTIHLTNHDDCLNIMIEDNGKGFNQSQITTKNKGMGISSIDKRIEHLKGKMTIESEINKGTTIIIDIPI